MIQLNNITLAFGERRLVEGVTTRFECGRMVALLGRNGTGKSTLLRAMAKLGDVAEGEILVDGKSIADIDIRQFARLVAFVNTEDFFKQIERKMAGPVYNHGLFRIFFEYIKFLFFAFFKN